MAACCSPLTTSTAARSTTSGHSAAASAADSGLRSWNARTAGSTEQGSAPACRSTEVIATASSPTAHELVRSPKSMIPSGVRRPRSSEADHVVVGHVAVHRLPRQPPGQRLHPVPGRTSRGRHPVPQVFVPHVPGQRVHHAQRVPQVPLQHPVQARVLEAAQRQADLPGHRTQARDDPRRQVASRARERPAGQKAQHPGQGPAPVDWAPVDGHLGRSVRHGRDPQIRARPRDMRGRGVLRLDLGRAERRVRDLQHAEHAAAVSQQEIAVLLAAQRLRLHREAEQSRDPFGLKDRHLRNRQPAVPEEIDPGHLRGRRQPGLPCLRRPAAAPRPAPRPARAAR